MLARNSAATIWNMVVRVARYLRSYSFFIASSEGSRAG